MINGEKTLRVFGKKIYVAAAGLFGFGMLLLVLYVLMSDAQAEVVFLRTSIPSTPASDAVLDEPVESIEMPPIEQVDPEERLVSALQKDDLQVAYEKMEDTERWHVVRMKVTGYCSCPKCCGKFSDGKTASQHRIRRGDVFVAADKQFSFGTEMIIPGYNNTQPVQVLDRGKAIKGNRLDLYFDTHRQAQKWGVKTVDVLVKTRD